MTFQCSKNCSGDFENFATVFIIYQNIFFSLWVRTILETQQNCLIFNFFGRNFDVAADGNGILYKKAAGFAYNVSQPCFHVFFFLFVPYFYLCHTLVVVKVSKSKPFFASIAQSSPPNLIRLCCPLCGFSEANN